MPSTETIVSVLALKFQRTYTVIPSAKNQPSASTNVILPSLALLPFSSYRHHLHSSTPPSPAVFQQAQLLSRASTRMPSPRPAPSSSSVDYKTTAAVVVIEFTSSSIVIIVSVRFWVRPSTMEGVANPCCRRLPRHICIPSTLTEPSCGLYCSYFDQILFITITVRVGRYSLKWRGDLNQQKYRRMLRITWTERVSFGENGNQKNTNT